MASFGLLLLILQALGLVSGGGNLIRKRQLTPEATRHWRRDQEAHGDSPVTIHIALRQPSTEDAISALEDVSNPSSENYGNHWRPRDVVNHFAPSTDDVQSVRNWLNQSGIAPSQESRHTSRGHLLVRSTVQEARSLLQTSFHRYTQRNTREGIVTSEDYHIPKSLDAIIDFITASGPDASVNGREMRRSTIPNATPRSLRIRQDEEKEGAKVNCDVYTAPSCLRSLYGIPQSPEPHPNSTLGIYHPAGVTWLEEDLDLFFSTFQPPLVGRRPEVEKVNGGYMQTEWEASPLNLETNLNFQYALSLTDPMEVTNIQVGDMYGGNVNNMLAAFDRFYCDQIDPELDFTYPNTQADGWNKSADCGNLTPPKVLSITYGDSEANYPPEYIERQCLEFLKLGLMGTTVVVASGDYGPMSGHSPGTCIDPGTGLSNSTSGRFSPSFPSSCPWVTTVGGTQMRAHAQGNTTEDNPSLRNRAKGENETAWDQVMRGIRVTSGGGFSNVFKTPEYQLDAVESYKEKEEKHLGDVQGNYNAWGRGIPDVSFLSHAYLMALHEQITTAAGTSASAPVFASMIAMINSERLKAGKGTVGFINPVLYENADIINDITEGVNVGCGADPAFRAVEGWDAVTGLGSVRYEALSEVFMNLP